MNGHIREYLYRCITALQIRFVIQSIFNILTFLVQNYSPERSIILKKIIVPIPDQTNFLIFPILTLIT